MKDNNMKKNLLKEEIVRNFMKHAGIDEYADTFIKESSEEKENPFAKKAKDKNTKKKEEVNEEFEAPEEDMEVLSDTEDPMSDPDMGEEMGPDESEMGSEETVSVDAGSFMADMSDALGDVMAKHFGEGVVDVDFEKGAMGSEPDMGGPSDDMGSGEGEFYDDEEESQQRLPESKQKYLVRMIAESVLENLKKKKILNKVNKTRPVVKAPMRKPLHKKK
jgi:hypothetical protein